MLCSGSTVRAVPSLTPGPVRLVPAENAPRLRETVPEIRPFRALRYDPETVGDLAAVVAPPYDVIDQDHEARLLALHPKNVVRLDLPGIAPGEEPDERYRRAARTLAAWRSDGTFHKDPRPAVYVYEQTYRVPGHRHGADAARVLRSVRLEAARSRVRRTAARAHA